MVMLLFVSQVWRLAPARDFSDDGFYNKSHQVIGKKTLEDHIWFGNSIAKRKDVIIRNGQAQIINITHTNLYFYEGWYMTKAFFKWQGVSMSNKELKAIFYNGLRTQSVAGKH